MKYYATSLVFTFAYTTTPLWLLRLLQLLLLLLNLLLLLILLLRLVLLPQGLWRTKGGRVKPKRASWENEHLASTKHLLLWKRAPRLYETLIFILGKRAPRPCEVLTFMKQAPRLHETFILWSVVSCKTEARVFRKRAPRLCETLVFVKTSTSPLRNIHFYLGKTSTSPLRNAHFYENEHLASTTRLFLYGVHPKSTHPQHPPPRN